MVEAFTSTNKIASLARVEGYFKDLKSSIIQKKTPRMRVDKFIVTHLRAIRGAVKLAKSDIDIGNKNVRCSNSSEKGNIKTLENNSEQVGKSINSIKTTVPLNQVQNMNTMNNLRL